jgi:hypothetical protein
LGIYRRLGFAPIPRSKKEPQLQAWRFLKKSSVNTNIQREMASKRVSLSPVDISVMKTGQLLERMSLDEYIPPEQVSAAAASDAAHPKVEDEPLVGLDRAFGRRDGLLPPLQVPHAPDWASANLLQKLRDEPHVFLGINTIILVVRLSPSSSPSAAESVVVVSHN